jgi:hypothetical protein
MQSWVTFQISFSFSNWWLWKLTLWLVGRRKTSVKFKVKTKSEETIQSFLMKSLTLTPRKSPTWLRLNGLRNRSSVFWKSLKRKWDLLMTMLLTQKTKGWIRWISLKDLACKYLKKTICYNISTIWKDFSLNLSLATSTVLRSNISNLLPKL